MTVGHKLLCVFCILLMGVIYAEDKKPVPAANLKGEPKEKVEEVPKGEVIRLKKFPFIAQAPEFSAEACIAMAMRGFGKRASQYTVFNFAQINPLEGRGLKLEEIPKVLARLGFRPADKTKPFNLSNSMLALAMAFHLMVADLRQGYPSMVLVRDKDADTGKLIQRFLLVVGYSSIRDEVIVHDPKRTNGAYILIPKKDFFNMWTIPTAPGKAQAVRFLLKPWKLIDLKESNEVTPADICQRIILVRNYSKGKVSIQISGPFVVIAPFSKELLKQAVDQWVTPVVTAMQKSYFPKNPSIVVEIWLARTSTEYNQVLTR
ncbi:MAG: hypothetical protein D6820_02355, partial [Lentisphaerae bacterium]